MNILIVDDDIHVGPGLSRLLSLSDYDGRVVGTPSSAGEALEIIKQMHVDVVISDISMPGVDGIELCRTLYERYPSIQVILLSGHSEFEYARSALRYKVNDYILKPITKDKVQKIDEILRKIYCQRRKEQETYGHFLSERTAERILDALKSVDIDYFDDLFSSENFRQAIGGSTGQATGIFFLNLLYSYLEKLQPEDEAVRRSRDQWISIYSNAPVAERSDIIVTQYIELLNSLDTKKQDSSGSLALQAIELMEENLADVDFNITALANELHVTISHLSTTFKQRTGQNLSTYLTDLRIKHACRLLRETPLIIADVGKQSGYDSPKYFAKVFKRKMGMRPSEYRNLTTVDVHEDFNAALPDAASYEYGEEDL